LRASNQVDIVKHLQRITELVYDVQGIAVPAERNALRTVELCAFALNRANQFACEKEVRGREILESGEDFDAGGHSRSAGYSYNLTRNVLEDITDGEAHV